MRRSENTLFKTYCYSIKMNRKIRILNYKCELDGKRKINREVIFEGLFKHFISSDSHVGYKCHLIDNSFLQYEDYLDDILELGICIGMGKDLVNVRSEKNDAFHSSYFILLPEDYKGHS